MDSNLLSTPDHDLLIKVDTKLDGISQRFGTFENSMAVRVLKVESRLDTMDIYHASIPLKEYDQAFHWVESFRSNINLLLAVGGLLLTILSSILTIYLQKWFHL